MANIEHSVVTDPEIHEPKGIAAAAVDQVYVADGAGSGTHKVIVPTNVVLVEAASDLPSAVAGVRTLADNTVYHIVGSVSIGSDRLVSGANTVIRGNSQSIDKLVSTTSGVFLTATTNSFRLYKIGFTITSGTFIAVSGSSNSHTFREVSCSCDIFGTVAGNRLTDLWRSRIQCVTNGLTFSGSCFRFNMDNATIDVTSGANSCVDFGVATFDSIRVHSASINNASGVDGFDIAAAGANLNAGGEGYIVLTDFLTGASATTGFAEGDPKWTMTANVGLQDNPATAQGSIENSALTTTFSGTGGGNDVLVNFGTAFVADIEQKFTISTAGAFTFNSNNNLPIHCVVNATVYASISGGATRVYNWYIALNGTIIESSIAKRDYDGTNAGSISLSSHVDVAAGDIITLRVRAETATTSIIADTVSISVAEG